MAALEKRKLTKKERYDQVNEYKRNTQRIYLLNFSKEYDADLIEWMEANKPYQGAFKWLVREQIKREAEEAKLTVQKET